MAIITDLGFTFDELNAAIADGKVRSQTHPEFPELSIYNYTEECQFRNIWNNITLQCRGLILNTDTGEVVARPWEKFFNFGQMDNRIDSSAPVEVTDKMDGSLGILYMRPDNKWAIATRGSFASEQALHATHLLNTLYEDYLVDWLGAYWLDQCTYLFEIVYPENRIVVDYGKMDDLVLLGAVNKMYGQYYGPGSAGAQIAWPGPKTETFAYATFVDALSAPDRAGKEGIVIRSGTKIVKLKQADYVELHRIVTNMSPRTIWEMLRDGKTIEDICKPLPDEFHKYVIDIGTKILDEVSDLHFKIKVAYQHAWGIAQAKSLNSLTPGVVSRRAYAEEFKKSKYASYMFSLLDDKSIQDALWKAVRPSGDVKLIKDDDA